MQKTYQFKNVGDVVLDEEHKSYSVNYTDAQGAVRTIDWALASAPESRQMLAKHAQIREQLVAPFLIEYAPKNKAEAAAEDEDEAEEIASAEGVADIAAAPGTVAEAKPAKRASNSAQDAGETKTASEVFEYGSER